MRTQQMVPLALVAVLAGGAVAAGQGNMPKPTYTGKSSGISWSMVVKFGKSGKPVRVTSFGWDGYPCQGDRYTGGNSKSIKVTNGKFSSTQLIGGVNAPFTVHGTFSADAKKVTGTVKLKGCGAARTWSMKKTGH